MLSTFCLTSALSLIVGAEAKVCARNHEDCSLNGCCQEPGRKCFKKDDFWAACRQSCTPGIHAWENPPEHRTSWSCELIDGSHPDCAEDGKDCIHLGCCKSMSHKCFMRNPGEAYCVPGNPPGWLGHQLTYQHARGETPNEDLSKNWNGGLHATHYWDCSGQGCDALNLQPWDRSRYVSPPEYAPMDPAKYGGSLYGENIWMTGSTSDAVSSILGPDANNCGSDNGGPGGCGQCLLVKNYHSNNKDWAAVIMRKNRCPPWTRGCGGGQFHIDLAVPGFDDLVYSTANICGNPGTTLSKQQSSICGSVKPADCNCWQIPVYTAALRRMREGCELFKQWGWWSGTPTLDWRPVPCPRKFVEQVQLGAAFGAKGPVTVSFFHADNNTSLRSKHHVLKHGPLRQGPQHWLRAVALLSLMLLVMGLVRGLVAVRCWHWHSAGYESLVAAEGRESRSLAIAAE